MAVARDQPPAFWLPQWKHGSGFTLLELLVVIGLILILLSLALPLLAKSFSGARTTRQTVAVQQNAMLLQLYAADFAELFPVAGYTHATSAAVYFYEPLIAGGYAASVTEIDPEGVGRDGKPNVVMSICLVYDAEKMRPGRTEPEMQRQTRPVRLSEVAWPSSKGSLMCRVVRDGRIISYWCCVDGAPKGPVAFCDGSIGLYGWRELLPPGEMYTENGVGQPVISTWDGFRGRDRQ
jgi:prepilin-type N-terminal cleavage/methylation domain-containing protein